MVLERLVASLEELPVVEEVLIAMTSQAGREILKQKKADVALIDVAVLDTHLPDESGISLLNFIKEIHYPLKSIIMMTSEPTEEEKNICLSLGASYFLNKFSEFEKIPEIVESIAQ